MKRGIVTLAVVGLTVPLIAGGVAHAAKKGPRASISVATVCSLEETDLTVELRVRDITSGNAFPVVTQWTIDASFLERGVRGHEYQTFDSASASGQFPVPKTVTATFSLCAGDGSGIRSDLEEARTLNGLAEIMYGKADGAGGVDDVRTISNRCSDDPETPEVEPDGIALSKQDVADIDIACVGVVP